MGTGGPIASATVPILAARPGEKYLKDLRRRLPDLRLTYEEVGATAGPVLPKGYHHDRVSTELGGGAHVWARAQEAVRTWQGHRRAGATIYPAEAIIAVGTEVVATVRLGLLFIVAPCRVVYVTAEPDRVGFAYGTLPGHPERGEEAFHVTRHGDGPVRFEIVAFSRPATVMARMGGPLSRLVQNRTTRLYLDGARRYATGHS
jgi:uncharacterized protein (UPF0548 family)